MACKKKWLVLWELVDLHWRDLEKILSCNPKKKRVELLSGRQIGSRLRLIFWIMTFVEQRYLFEIYENNGLRRELRN